MEVVGRGVVCASREKTDRQSCAFPGICVLPSGRWICSFRAAPSKTSSVGQQVLICSSDDRGRSWSEPFAPFSPPDVDGKSGLFRSAYLTVLGGNRLVAAISWVDHSDPSLPYVNEETQGVLDSRIFLSWSLDGGQKWSEPSLMDTSPFDAPTLLTGPVLCLPNGETGCQFETSKSYYDTSSPQFTSVMMFSGDGGRTWPKYITSNDPSHEIFYWDQRPGILAYGSVLNLFWAYGSHESKYLNIQARQSFDGGHKWSKIWDTEVFGQPGQPVSTPDGGIVMVYVDRVGSPAIKMRKSSDGGMTWPIESEILLYRTRLSSQSQEKRSLKDARAESDAYSVGLPATAVLPGGEIVVVYYAGPKADQTDILWCLVKNQG